MRPAPPPRIQDDGLPKRAVLAIEHSCGYHGILGRVATTDRAKFRMHQPVVARIDRVLLDRSPIPVVIHDAIRAGQRQFVHPLPRRDYQHAIAAELAKHLGHRPRGVDVPDADNLAADAGRVAERSQNVEDGREAETAPYRHDVLMAG